MRATRILALTGSVALMVGVLATPSVAGAPLAERITAPRAVLPTRLPTYRVTQAGLTQTQADTLARTLDVPRAFDRDGSFRFVSGRLGDIPMVQGQGDFKADEGGGQTTAMAFDFDAIARIAPIANSRALSMAASAFSQAGIRLPANTARVSNTTLTFEPVGGEPTSRKIDTNVRYEFKLSGQPYTGPGAKADVTFDPAGNIIGLHHSVFQVAVGSSVGLIPSADAIRTCAARFPPRAKVSVGLLYWAPPLSSRVKTIFPWYECKGTTAGGRQLVSALIPAVAGAAPSITLRTTLSSRRVTGAATVSGGTKPYAYSWQSTTTDLAASASNKATVAYNVRPRSRTTSETLILTVTDANGLTKSIEKTLTIPATGGSSTVVLAGLRPVAQSVGTLDVGGEFTVWDWQCVKDSASGFQSTFTANGVPVAFKWTGNNAWEQDFRDTATAGGDDSDWVDNVDLAWYTGHGNPGGFSFDNDDHSDGNIVPADALWGQRDLEWLQLESCNVLQFTDGAGNAFARWGQRFDGLHLLNGFQTTASCVNVSGGTAGRFSRYLFPISLPFVTIPALKVRQAWAQMAKDLEPSGKQWVSMGVYGAGGVTNYDDFFWGQGPVGPDIPKSQITGRWWLMGTV